MARGWRKGGDRGGSNAATVWRLGTRYIAFDLGNKRTGIATGDSVTGLAGPVGVIEVPLEDRGGAALLEAIALAVEDALGVRNAFRGGGDGEVVVGLPVNMDGTEGPRATAVRAFAGRIAERTGRVVHLHDERLTTADADWALARSGLTHKQKKERRDALAAAAILRDFLAGLGRGGGGDEPDEGGAE